MSSLIIKTIFIASFVTVISSARGHAAGLFDTEDLWSCSGYCFTGGDSAGNQWIPVGSYGSTEEEARENIDCGQFFEEGITCEMVAID
jgi:hypothetical protein